MWLFLASEEGEKKARGMSEIKYTRRNPGHPSFRFIDISLWRKGQNVTRGSTSLPLGSTNSQEMINGCPASSSRRSLTRTKVLVAGERGPESGASLNINASAQSLHDVICEPLKWTERWIEVSLIWSRKRVDVVSWCWIVRFKRAKGHREIYLTISLPTDEWYHCAVRVLPEHALHPSAVSAGKWIQCRRLLDKINIDDLFRRLSALSSAVSNTFLSRVIQHQVLFESEGFQSAFYRPTERTKSDPSDIVHRHCHRRWSLDSSIHLKMIFEMQHLGNRPFSLTSRTNDSFKR